ncbi:hypothetical protein LOD99_2332 [Oopsacas minuta]|uniref:Uncharacterized protein n=1 Tax=Oopsacas minuta TaxID=111878 RepID=A0AAV7K285_9METZ|nr:hypothetical protein LOD99_2332 [Oopsacas minuta]
MATNATDIYTTDAFINERIHKLENSIKSKKKYDMNIDFFNREINDLFMLGKLTKGQIDGLRNDRYLQTKKRATTKNQLENKRKEKLAERELYNLENLKKQLEIERIMLQIQIEEIILKIQKI